MNRAILIVIAIIIISGILGYTTYSYFFKQQEGEVTPTESTGLKPVNITIMTAWGQWARDDFKRYFFAESGMPRAGVFESPAAMIWNVTDIVYVFSNDLNEWVKAGIEGSVDGFMGGPRYNFTLACLYGAFKPIEDPVILELAKYIPEPLKGYTADGKLCWITMYYNIFGWLVNKKYAERNNLIIPESWDDLIKPEYVIAATINNIVIFASTPVTDRGNMENAVTIILSKYGWEKGWAIIATIFSGIATVEPNVRSARDAVLLLDKALLSYLEFPECYRAYSLDPQKMSIVFPKNGTGLWLSGIAIAKGTDKEGVEGMYRLIKWWLTDAQDKMLLNRSGWLHMPVLGLNNPSPRMEFKRKADPNLYLPPIDLEIKLGNASNVIFLYADLKIDNATIRNMIKEYLKKVSELYLRKEISIDEYYNYIYQLGKPVEFIDPLTGEKTQLTLDKAVELGLALQRGNINISLLKQVLGNALVEKMKNLLNLFSI